MERKTIPLRFCKSKVPLVTFRLAGEEHYAIIDTGSEITMLDIGLKEKIKTKEIDTETNLVGVNGGSGYQNFLQGACKAELNTVEGETINTMFGGMVHDLKAISSHFKDKNGEYIKISALIGGDFLRHYQAKIDYKKKTITIDEMAE